MASTDPGAAENLLEKAPSMGSESRFDGFRSQQRVRPDRGVGETLDKAQLLLGRQNQEVTTTHHVPLDERGIRRDVVRRRRTARATSGTTFRSSPSRRNQRRRRSETPARRFRWRSRTRFARGPDGRRCQLIHGATPMADCVAEDFGQQTWPGIHFSPVAQTRNQPDRSPGRLRRDQLMFYRCCSTAANA